MPLLLDALYLLGLLVLSPWLLFRAFRTGRYRHALRDRLFGLERARPMIAAIHPGARPVWFHGVSVGEVHLLRQVIAAFRKRHPERPCVVSTTTDTGFEEARKAFPDLPVIHFPFDFTWAVRRTMRAVDPALVVLAEGELWPNFLLAARGRGVPVAVVNGRMSPRSLRRYRRLAPLARRLIGLIDLLAVQTDAYYAAVRALGAEPGRVHVTGSVKFDGVTTDRHDPRTETLRQLFRVTEDDLVWVAGSTQATEEEVVIDMYRRLREIHPNLRLFLVPRQKDRFDEVAKLLDRSVVSFVRRSALQTAIRDPQKNTILVDTIGELGALWGLADVAFVGGSLDGRRGGQNMIEPAAYGAAVVFGPHVWNFRDVAARLVAAGGARQVADTEELERVMAGLLDHAEERRRLGAAARDFVLQQQGATGRTVELLGSLLDLKEKPARAA
jgi:3-deoxy-D-manno-octulosonic-acid transferase